MTLPPTWARRRRSSRVASRDEAGEARFQQPPIEKDVAAAALAAEADVRAEAVDQPLGAAAWMGSAKPDDIAQEQLEGRPG